MQLKKMEVGKSVEYNTNQKISITEFSPEWDSTNGGSKMVVCFQPNILYFEQNKKFKIYFDDVPTPTVLFQPGVFKCFVPKHEKGIVKIKVFYDSVRIDEPYDKPSLFEFKSLESERKRKKKIAIFDKDQDFYNSEFKVILVEKLYSI